MENKWRKEGKSLITKSLVSMLLGVIITSLIVVVIIAIGMDYDGNIGVIPTLIAEVVFFAGIILSAAYSAYYLVWGCAYVWRASTKEVENE